MAMQVLVIRHAIAADRDSFKKTGMADDLRPLTVEGRKKMRRGAQGLKRVIKSLDLIASSPLVRAIETAHVVAKSFEKTPVLELAGLAPGGRPEAIFKFLVDQRKATVALIGHEPDLSRLVSLALGCDIHDRLPLKKGGCALIAFQGPVAAGAGTLRMLMPPQWVRKLAK